MKDVSKIAAGVALAAACAAASAEPVKLPRSVPYAQDNDVAGNIKNECRLGDQLAGFIAEYAKQRGIATETVAATDDKTPGRVLVIEIRNAESQGNAFIGHRKSTGVRGALYQDGAKVGSFRARRDSMGGAFAGFKGSCSVLGRTVKALGGDIAEWLAKPSENAELGDLK